MAQLALDLEGSVVGGLYLASSSCPLPLLSLLRPSILCLLQDQAALLLTNKDARDQLTRLAEGGDEVSLCCCDVLCAAAL